jgi:hypothetical protein
MRNYSDPDDDYDYSPNELAHLSESNKGLHDRIINLNLAHNDDNRSIHQWEQDNLKWAQECLAQQRANRR